MQDSHTQDRVEQQLDSFDPKARREALETIAAGVALPPQKHEVNLHYHTFHSFNAKGWSPSHIALEAARCGLGMAGIVDFDTLAAMEEFLQAGDLLKLKVVAGLETRVFIPELADKVTNSPNEPGIAYFVATGCRRLPAAGTRAAAALSNMLQMARNRTQSMADRINAYLVGVQLDYEADVIPLTPLGNATERHLLTAYERKALEVFGGDPSKTARFWSEKLQLPENQVEALQQDQPKFHNAIRAKLMKFGGIAYAKPESHAFPTLDEVIGTTKDIGALPVMCWLDGMSEGEDDANSLVEFYISKGCEALSIVPDRNWRIKDEVEKARKVAKLAEIVEIAARHHLPIMIGTEMNQAGQPFVDDFSAPDMQPYIPLFLEGARRIHERSISGA